MLKGLGRVVVCYSGGVDSTLLLRAAVDALGKERVLALIARSETYPESEIERRSPLPRPVKRLRGDRNGRDGRRLFPQQHERAVLLL